MKIIGLCVGLLIGFGACQSHRDTVVGIRAEGIPVPEKVVLSISDSTYEIFPDSLGIVRFVLPPGIRVVTLLADGENCSFPFIWNRVKTWRSR